MATSYQFSGDKGTVCTIVVNADASTGVGALSGLPRVGVSSNPGCRYRTNPAGAAAGAKASNKAAKKACRKKRGKAKRRCKAKHRKAANRAAPRAVSGAALLDLAKLNLVGPLGAKIPGLRTLVALANGGYQCLLEVGADCSDNFELEPALPSFSYTAQFSARMTPPPGEHWVSTPPGCLVAGGAAVSCVMSSAPVTPTLI
jgi:hypothetical protein